jgi:hypothetical protein
MYRSSCRMETTIGRVAVVVAPHTQNGSFRTLAVLFFVGIYNIIYTHVINTKYPFARGACIADKRTTKGRYSTRMGLNNILETRTGRRYRSVLTPRTERGA